MVEVIEWFKTGIFVFTSSSKAFVHFSSDVWIYQLKKIPDTQAAIGVFHYETLVRTKTFWNNFSKISMVYKAAEGSNQARV